MKKSSLSLLLCLAMVVILFAGMSTTAYAETITWEFNKIDWNNIMVMEEPLGVDQKWQIDNITLTAANLQIIDGLKYRIDQPVFTVTNGKFSGITITCTNADVESPYNDEWDVTTNNSTTIATWPKTAGTTSSSVSGPEINRKLPYSR